MYFFFYIYIYSYLYIYILYFLCIYIYIKYRGSQNKICTCVSASPNIPGPLLSEQIDFPT